MADVFAELRALLLQPSSKELWDDLCVFFARLPDNAPVETLLEYANSHMENWPDKLRFLRSEDFLKWCHLAPDANAQEVWNALAQPEKVAFWPLVRHWELESHHEEEFVPWKQLLPAHSLQHLTRLTLFREMSRGMFEEDEGSAIVVLSKLPVMPNLTHLALEVEELSEEEWHCLAQTKSFPALRSLELDIDEILAYEVFGCLLNPGFSNIECLSLTSQEALDAEFVQVLEQCDGLQLLRELRLDFEQIGLEELCRLLASPNLRKLECLSVHARETYQSYEAGDFQFLVDCDALPSLKKLHLHGLNLELDGAFFSALTQLSCAKQLEELVLESTRLRAGDFLLFCERRPPLSVLKIKNSRLFSGELSAFDVLLPTLEHLELNYCELEEKEFESWKSVTDSPLHTLQLRHCQLSNEGALCLASLPFSASLRSLNLSSNNIGVEGMQALLRSGWMSRLESLEMELNRIGSGGFDGFAKTAMGETLQKLRLTGCSLTQHDLKELAVHPHLSLQDLSLDGNELGAEGLHPLLSSSAIWGLRSLNLRGTLSNSRVFESLLSHESLPELRSLDLQENAFLDVTELAGYEGLPRLRKLLLSFCPLDKESLLALSTMTQLLELEAFESDVAPEDFLEVLQGWDNPGLHELDLTPASVEEVEDEINVVARSNPALARIRGQEWFVDEW